jgi:hypothetical protein
MRNLIKLFSLIILLNGCSKDEDPKIDTTPTGSVNSPIYFFQSNNLRSFNLDNQGGGTFEKVSDDDLTNEIYSIAYDPSEGTLFGFTDYWSFTYTGEYYESYNPTTKERVKVKIGENTDYHSVAYNTTLNKKILIKLDNNSYEKVIFQEVSSQGIIISESAVIDLGMQVTNFTYNSGSDAFIAMDDNYTNLKISVIDANTYSLTTVTISVDNPTTPIGSDFNYSGLTYDKQNDIIYYLRSNGLHVIDLNNETAQLIETDWIAFFQSRYSSDDLDDVETIYYPPTNELVIQGSGFFGNSSGSSKFFAIDLSTNKAREITTDRHTLNRVYGFAMNN